MHRRALLRSAGLVAGAAAMGTLVGGCGSDEQPESPPAEEATANTSSGAPQTLNVVSASFETLSGSDRRYAFGVATKDNQPLEDAELQVRVRDMDGTELAGPFSATFVEHSGPLGLYLTHIDVADPGRFLVEVSDGQRIGEVAINVVDPGNSVLPTPGDEAIVTATPTAQEPMGMEELCTLQPDDCGMHEVSLDEALAAGRPVMLLFATPAYCQTAMCGPAVEMLDEVRTDGDWGDVAFVHVEIFADAGQTLSPPVQEWDLPTEPWLFAVGGDGVIVERMDGIMVADELRALAGELA